MNINWHWRSFQTLTTLELFHALKLRAEIFIVEQGDLYTDPDMDDLHAWHLLGYNDAGQLMTYGRVILPQGERHALKLGRIVVDQACRGLQLGQRLLTEMLNWVKHHHDYRALPLELNAQYYLEAFYQKFGFQSVGEQYYIGAIAHIDMQRGPIVASE